MSPKELISFWLALLFFVFSFFFVELDCTLSCGTLFMLKLILTGLQVKPGLPYLDIIRLLRDNSALPIAAYQVVSISICFAFTV